jgi:ATP-dependent Clp protease ATP-binding subunit ClpA
MVDSVILRTRQEHGIELIISEEVRQTLRELCVDSSLKMGGRGVGSQLESKLVNPLGRYLFDTLDPNKPAITRLEITQLVDSNRDGIHEIVAR